MPQHLMTLHLYNSESIDIENTVDMERSRASPHVLQRCFHTHENYLYINHHDSFDHRLPRWKTNLDV